VARCSDGGSDTVSRQHRRDDEQVPIIEQAGQRQWLTVSHLHDGKEQDWSK